MYSNVRAACDWLLATCSELQRNEPQFVAASTGPECMQEGPCCAPGQLLLAPGLGGRSAKFPRQSEFYLYLSLPAAYYMQSLKKPILVLEMHEVGSK